MGKGTRTPFQARRSARLHGQGLGRISILINKRECLSKVFNAGSLPQARVVSTNAAPKKHQRTQDLTQTLPDALVEEVFRTLGPADVRSCSAVCKRWRSLANSAIVWKPLCEELWAGKQFVPSPEEGCCYRRLYCTSLAEGERVDLNVDDLCGTGWTFRFKLQAGHYWTSNDPYWTREGPLMQRQFKPDGSLEGHPAHSPLWNPAWESRWRFTKSSRGKRGLYVKVNHWPALSISRTTDWGWKLENCWVEYLSIPAGATLAPVGSSPVPSTV